MKCCLLLFVAIFVLPSQSANILGFFPHPGKSHFDVFQVLMEALAERGHNVTVVSFFPHKKPPPGYTDVSLEGLHEIYVHVVDFEDSNQKYPQFVRPFLELSMVSAMAVSTCIAILPSPQTQKILQSEFDLVVMEQFNTDCFLPMVYKLQAPYIGISSCDSMPWLLNRMGNPTNPSYIPSIFLPISDRANLWERLQNTIVHLAMPPLYELWAHRPVYQLIEDTFGPIPPLEELAQNTSLLLLNTHFTLHQPRPFVPGVVEVGGMHVKPAKPLPQDLEKFIMEAKDGVILFSLGSMLRIETFPREKVDAFLKVFAELPQRIIWKLSGKISGLPPNVLPLSWLPQRDILGHRNVRAFIAHGGLLGMTEAIYSGKPLVTIPVFGDQPHNVAAAVEAGVAVRLPYTEITEETVRAALQTVLSPEMRKKAKDLAAAFNDRPNHPLDEAVYWTEYVLRNGGKYLRSASVDLPFVQYYLIDVAAILLSTVAVVFIVVKKLLCLVSRLTVGSRERVKQD